MELFRKKKDEYRVAVWDGTSNPVKTYGVSSFQAHNQGLVLWYKDGKEAEDMVLVPRGYKYRMDGEVKVVAKHLGNNSACRWWEFGECVDENCPGVDLTELVLANMAYRQTKALYGHSPFPWKMVLVIVGIVICGLIVLKIMGVDLPGPL